LQPRCNGKGGFAAKPGWRVKQCSLACRTTKPGLGPAADLPLLLRRNYSAFYISAQPATGMCPVKTVVNAVMMLRDCLFRVARYERMQQNA
jgi:hypothetical protein